MFFLINSYLDYYLSRSYLDRAMLANQLNSSIDHEESSGCCDCHEIFRISYSYMIICASTLTTSGGNMRFHSSTK